MKAQRDVRLSVISRWWLSHADYDVSSVKPSEDPNVRGDAFKTVIVARLSYDADERDLEREFGRFGPIERVCLAWLERNGKGRMLTLC